MKCVCVCVWGGGGGVRKPEYPEKSPGDELQKMPHTTARRFKPQARLDPCSIALVAG